MFYLRDHTRCSILLRMGRLWMRLSSLKIELFRSIRNSAWKITTVCLKREMMVKRNGLMTRFDKIYKVGSAQSRDLVEYAIVDKKVIIVSPTSFFAYLQTVLQGLKALQIEESAKEIRKRVEELGRHLSSYETYMQKLGDHLVTSVNTYNKAYKE